MNNKQSMSRSYLIWKQTNINTSTDDCDDFFSFSAATETPDEPFSEYEYAGDLELLRRAITISYEVTQTQKNIWTPFDNNHSNDQE